MWLCVSSHKFKVDYDSNCKFEWDAKSDWKWFRVFDCVTQWCVVVVFGVQYCVCCRWLLDVWNVCMLNNCTCCRTSVREENWMLMLVQCVWDCVTLCGHVGCVAVSVNWCGICGIVEPMWCHMLVCASCVCGMCIVVQCVIMCGVCTCVCLWYYLACIG